MKVIAYVEKIIPVEVEVDDKWKPMEEYGNTPWKELTGDQDGYLEENQEEFYNDVCKALEEIGENSHNLHSIYTTIGGNIMEDLQEY
mgnify:CR=1 FL=1